jgi:6-phosphogluconolactonase (cycloisomerase 2 family)
MAKIENEIQYNWTVNRVEQLLPQVDDNTPLSDPNSIELELETMCTSFTFFNTFKMKKPYFLTILLFCSLFISCSSRASKEKETTNISGYYLLVGTYTERTSTGIYVYDLNPETGDLSFLSVSPDISNPSYLAVSGDGNQVYSVSEDDLGNASVSSFAFDKNSGTLKYVNTQRTEGAHPCYIAVNKGNDFITTANYTGGNLSVFPLKKDGSLEPASQIYGYQDKTDIDIPSHIHTTFFSPDEKYLFVTDLGKDRIYRYTVKLNPGNRLFLQEQQTAAELERGSGPRHLTFHPNGNYLYCINELSGKVTVFRYDEGNINQIQSIASDTTSGDGNKGSADIHMTPDGRFLYASNRLKADGIAIFEVNEDGSLQPAGYQPTGTHPRNFLISPDGKFLLVASRDSNNVCVFEINKQTGLLSATQKEIKVDKPVCLKLIPKL